MSAAEDFTAAAQRGINWIVAQQKEDGGFRPPEEGIGAYYKVPYALSLHGRLPQGLRLAQWIAAHHATPQGDFRAPQRKALEPVHDAWPAYGNAWLVQGLHRLGRWDLSRRGMAYLLKNQAEAGGFCALDDGIPYFEPVNTAWGGLAALCTGHLGAARRAGDLLAAMALNQPDPRRFYFRMDTAANLLTQVPAGTESSHFVDAGQTEQIYYNPGIALIFLPQLYRATDEARYLEASEALFAFSQRCAGDVYAFPPSGKLGLGCALHYSISGDPAARDAAVQVGQYLVSSQTADGYWGLPDAGPYRVLKDRDSFDVHLDITAEFSTFLSEIAARV